MQIYLWKWIKSSKWKPNTQTDLTGSSFAVGKSFSSLRLPQKCLFRNMGHSKQPSVLTMIMVCVNFNGEDKNAISSWFKMRLQTELSVKFLSVIEKSTNLLSNHKEEREKNAMCFSNMYNRICLGWNLKFSQNLEIQILFAYLFFDSFSSELLDIHQHWETVMFAILAFVKKGVHSFQFVRQFIVHI